MLRPYDVARCPRRNVCYAESQSLGTYGTYTSKVVTSQPYVSPTGVGLAFDSTGNAGAIAYTGVGGDTARRWNDAAPTTPFLTRATGRQLRRPRAGLSGLAERRARGRAGDGKCLWQNVCIEGT